MAEFNPRDLPVLLIYNLDPAWDAPEREQVADASSQLAAALSGEGHPVELVPVEDGTVTSSLSAYGPEAHTVFNWCESYPNIPGSESLVANDLEKMGFNFTGSAAAVLELSQDKAAAKGILEQNGVHTPLGSVFHRPRINGWNRYPAIVKAANAHCSEGLDRNSVVTNARELTERIAYVLDVFRQPALVEDFIDGREFHVSIIGNDHLEMLPVAEMDYSGLQDFHDHVCCYDAKFSPDSDACRKIGTLLPAPLGENELQALREACFAAYRAIGCRDYGRIDVRLRDGIFYVLDVNPNPDLSVDASTACAAELAGYNYGQLGSRIVWLAAQRADETGGAA